MKNNPLWTVLEHFEAAVTFFFFVVMCFFVFLQLFFRFVLNHPLLYPEEVSRASYVWLSFIGMSLVSKTREHIRVDFFVGLLPVLPRRWVKLVVDVLMLLMLAGLGWIGVQFVIFSRMSITPALEVPMNLFYVSFPIGCLLSVVRMSRNVVVDLREALAPQAADRAD